MNYRLHERPEDDDGVKRASWYIGAAIVFGALIISNLYLGIVGIQHGGFGRSDSAKAPIFAPIMR
jgi:hypothetical protein